jgi:hypothetical protein
MSIRSRPGGARVPLIVGIAAVVLMIVAVPVVYFASRAG